MTNYEFYKEQLKEIKSESVSCGSYTALCNFLQKHIHGGDCTVNNCSICSDLFTIWLLEEYETDWSKVKVDTPIFAWDYEDEGPYKRYFARYENGKIYAYDGGYTSWSSNGDTTGWRHARLAEEAGINEKTENNR